MRLKLEFGKDFQKEPAEFPVLSASSNTLNP